MTTESATQGNDDKPGNPFGCAAYGCPLNGSLSAGTTGGGPWYCTHHFGVRPENRDEVTAKIRANVWIARLAERARQIDPTHWESAKAMAKAFCEQRQRPDLAPGADESRGLYVSRLIAALGDLVAPTAKQETIKIDEPKKLPTAGYITDFLPEAA